MGVQEMALPLTKIMFRDHFIIDIFCHITIMKWSRINKKSIKKCIFWDIFILGLISIKFPIVLLKTYHHRKEKSYKGSRDSFGNGMTRGTTLEGVEYLVVTKVQIKSPWYFAQKLWTQSKTLNLESFVILEGVKSSFKWFEAALKQLQMV